MSPDEQEITAEFAAEDLGGTPPRESSLAFTHITFAAKTDLGRARENNEDKFDWWEPEDSAVLANRGRLYVVADGMGGHAAGQIASEMAIKAIGTTYFAGLKSSPEETLIRAITQANSIVHDTARAIMARRGMGCTVVAAAVIDADLVVAWAGDSRAYRVRGGRAERLTVDHSMVEEQVRQGIITAEQAQYSPHRNIITRSVGSEPGVQPDVRRFDLQTGDVILLCSDGLTGPVSDAEIADLAAIGPPSFACGALIDLANERGGPDNITVAILRVNDVECLEAGSESGKAGRPEPSVVTEEAPAPEPAPRKRRGLLWRR